MRALIRGDLDGIVSAVLLKAVGMASSVKIVRISDLNQGKVDVTNKDILCNLPYSPKAHLWFDHHLSESKHSKTPADYKGAFGISPSTARLVYQYFLPFHTALKKFEPLIADTDMVDSANLEIGHVLHPTGNVLLGFLLDPRTGIRRYPEYVDPYNEWKLKLVDLLLTTEPEEVINMPESQKWARIYFEAQEDGVQALKECTRLIGNIIFSDFRGKVVPPVNRFMIYALPEFAAGNISVQVSDGEPGVWTEISVGHSIFNRTSQVDVGDLCSWYGGGGHSAVGVCRPGIEDTPQVLEEVLASCRDRQAVAG